MYDVVALLSFIGGGGWGVWGGDSDSLKSEFLTKPTV